MKSIIFVSTILLSLSQISFANSHKYNVNDLEGTYLVQGIEIPYEAVVTLSTEYGIPTVDFIESQSNLKCKGFYSMSYGIELDINLYCGENMTLELAYQNMMSEIPFDFSQNVNLKNVNQDDIQSQFTAPVKSTLYGENELNFTFSRQ